MASGVSSVLGLPLNKVKVECRRAGGGFGGKFTPSVLPGSAAALAAYVSGRYLPSTQTHIV